MLMGLIKGKKVSLIVEKLTMRNSKLEAENTNLKEELQQLQNTLIT
jgi:cell division protein FtsB